MPKAKKVEEDRVAMQSATRNPLGHTLAELNDSIVDLPAFEDKKILKVLNVSISEDTEPVYMCVNEDGDKVSVPVEHFNQ